jgi:hypothetical protein
MATARNSLATLAAALVEVEWSLLDLEPAILDSFIAAGDASGTDTDQFNFEVCGIGDDPSANPDGDSEADNLPLEGTRNEEIEADLVAAGLTEDEARCIIAKIGDDDPDAMTEDAVLLMFLECGVSVDRLAQLSG